MMLAIVACGLALQSDAPQSASAPASAPAAPAASLKLSDATPLVLGVDEPLTVTAEVGAWVARLTGKARVGAGGTSFDLNTDLAVGETMAGFAGELAVWVDRWRFGLVGFQASGDDNQRARKAGLFGTTAIAQGDRLHGDLSTWMAGAEVGYVVWRPFADQPWPWSPAGANRQQATEAMGANGRPIFDLRVIALAGGLGFGYSQTLENTTTASASSFDKTVGAIYGGGGLDIAIGMDNRVPLLQDLHIYGYAGVGPSIPDADVVWMIRVGIAAMFTPNVGVEFGYRLFDFNLQDGPSDVDGGVRGIFAALSLKF